jgi:hypothetical protein
MQHLILYILKQSNVTVAQKKENMHSEFKVEILWKSDHLKTEVAEPS